MSRKVFGESLMGATRVSCMILFILAGASYLGMAMGFTGIPRALAEWIAHQGLETSAGAAGAVLVRHRFTRTSIPT